MRKILFRELALSELKKFIHSYEEGFFILYQDSGLWNEGDIINHYRRVAKKLSDRIFAGIERHLKNKKVLGRKRNGRWNELDFYIGGRLIIVYFSDDLMDEIRWIESINIDRKPIIF